ncbi:ABC transporter permease [Xanthomonas euroxanthea]|uniref:Transport permease protein n=1 Tax=Xanthomonas euroxanthea TaxID=2259622 RepID=A0A8E4EX05_9XANT|nr:ABC transporter permease [Xanthomonas euroxanthea]CAD1795765.1 ABC transporter permease [Xanthomonas euroxanthea]SYZ55226.1 ABC transporter permease [Xanthomonas arboricola pv. juglandis]
MNEAISDLRRSLLSWRLWTLLGWLEIRQRYARSRVGPFWLTISMGVIIASIGMVYGTLFGQKLSEYLPYLAISLVMWGMFTSTVQEGSNAFIANASYIRQVATPKFIYILQVPWRNLLILAHNIVIVVLLLAIFGVKRWDTILLVIPGILLLVLNATWMATLSGILSARFRDFPQIVAAVMQVAFYVTPIMYKPEALTKYSFIVNLNPMAYLLNAVRQPLLGEVPSARTWTVAIVMAIAGWLVALVMINRYHKRISYWV